MMMANKSILCQFPLRAKRDHEDGYRHHGGARARGKQSPWMRSQDARRSGVKEACAK